VSELAGWPVGCAARRTPPATETKKNHLMGLLGWVSGRWVGTCVRRAVRWDPDPAFAGLARSVLLLGGAGRVGCVRGLAVAPRLVWRGRRARPCCPGPWRRVVYSVCGLGSGVVAPHAGHVV